MKKKKSVIIIILSVIVVALIAVLLYFVLYDKNKLTVVERNWVNENISTIQNINVVNDANVFGKNGSGVFYSFIDSFKNEYGLTINPITYNIGTIPSGITFGVKNKAADDDVIFYTDHYVVVGKSSENLATEDNLNGKTIGILANSLTYVSTYLKNSSNVSFTQFETEEELLQAMGSTVNYMIVPLMEYLDIILSENYYVLYHLSDIKTYYVLDTDDSTLSRILKKYYNKWQDNFEKAYNDSLFDTFTSAMKITETEIDSMQSVSYNYGFVNASPYEVIMGGKYGGISAVYLSKFSEFADVEFNFKKYSSFKKFESAVKKGEIDLYFNYYNYSDNYNSTAGLNIEYVVAAPRKDNTVIKSIYSLIGKTVYVQKDSKIHNYVKGISGINVKTFSTTKELFKLNKKNVYLVLDKNTFEYYSDKNLNNYTDRYSSYISGKYTFKVKTSSSLYRLLNKYVEVLDENEIILEGLENHYETVKSGSVITKVAEYTLYAIIIVIVIALIVIKKSKRISIARPSP